MGLLLFGSNQGSWSENQEMGTMSTQAETLNKETKAQRVERLKREKNPLQCLDEVREFASQGQAAIPDAWIKTYFRWWGVYTQGDGVGAIGGTGGEGKATPYFMLRIRLGNGFLRSRQLRAIADLSTNYAMHLRWSTKPSNC